MDKSRRAELDLRYAIVEKKDISNLDVRDVKFMRQMLYGLRDFNQDIGNWNVSNVNNMREMFESAVAFNQDIGNWNVSNVASMEHMFYNARSFNQDIGNWNVSKVKHMGWMFCDAVNFNQDISNWSISEDTSTCGIFYGAKAFIEGEYFDKTIEKWAKKRGRTVQELIDNVNPKL